ncbi:uncharacterized protein LOC123916563 [Trifolium pratense]|uniref:uncharacterized protein LOC123916563 n=1 Tax=Trifolium pratense TaxID=57577 RepID=UPI001E692962|nr:uncharacterized protein LOC123916563 [Trifolium pratense]
MASSEVEIASFNLSQNQKTQKPTWVSRVAKNNNNLGTLKFNKRFHNVFSEQDDSSLSALVSPRHSKIVDRWATRQAQEVVTNLGKKNNEDAVKVFDKFSTRSSSFNYRRGREDSVSPPRSDGSSDSEKASGLGASSLVRIWEKRLNNQSNCTKQNVPLAGRTNSDSSCNDTNACSVEDHGRVSEEEDSSDEPFTCWEYDKTKVSTDQNCLPKVKCNSDAVESEKSKVADIIKRLYVDNDQELSNGAASSPFRERDCVSTPKQLMEHKSFGKVRSHPRIRGRQAFNDLMTHFECDRHGELNNLAERGAVSKFTQRGRIQSLLRLRLLQRGVAVFDPSRPKSTRHGGNKHQQGSTGHEGNKQQQGSVIMQLRERFDTRDERRISSLKEVTVIHCKKHTQNPVSQTNAGVKEEEHLSCGFEAQNDDPKETVEESSSKVDSNANEMVDEVEARDQQLYDTIETDYNEILEEKECSEYNYDETSASYDWISSISRPKSYWEELRQEWYREVLDFGSGNDERRELLQRKTVSTVLCSDFRERMDKLMKSHVGTQTHLVSNQHDEEDPEESMEKLMAFYYDRLRVRGSPEEDGKDRNEKEVSEEDECINSGSDHELGDCHSGSDHELGDCSPSIHTPSSTTWSYRDTDGGDDSARAAFVSSPLHSQPFYPDSRLSSPANQPSIEMEIIYHLRGQMELLYQEMSELRKTLKNCTDMQMQMQLQQSQNQAVHKVKGKKSSNKKSKKGNCCICNENKVNSVLYRCGHMCACLKCAKELQWKSGKCPICQVEIIDVVKVHTNT